MNLKDLVTYYKMNIKEINKNFNIVYNLNKEDCDLLFFNLFYSLSYNKDITIKDISYDIFNIVNLEKLKNALVDMKIKDDKIKDIITKSPIIILYSNRLDSIYYLYKNNKYFGYTVLDEDKYNTFLLNNNINSNVFSNNYIVNNMLEYHNVKNNNKEEFDRIEEDYKLKNYYFKKKR